MPSKIVRRILAQSGMPDLFDVLARDLPLSDLQSLLLEVYQARSRSLAEPDVIERAQRGVMRPSQVEARQFHQFDAAAFATAGEFEAVELSPVGPLGLNRVLGEVGQNSVLTTIRGSEVLGDATMSMAIECAGRRKASQKVVRLCSSHRVVRMQPFDVPGYVPHFRLFSLVSAGRDTGSSGFEKEHFGEHVGFYLRLFRALAKQGFGFDSPLVEISDPEITRVLLESQGIAPDQVREAIRAHRPGGSQRFLAEHGVTLPDAVEEPASELADVGARFGLEAQIQRLSGLRARVSEILKAFPQASFRFNFSRLEGLAYYSGPSLRISPVAPDGQRYAIVDGGFTDWTARLLQDKKERLFTSGIGTEFVCVRYRVLA